MFQKEEKLPGHLLKEAKDIQKTLFEKKPNPNVLVVGTIAVGKSSLINSMITSIDPRGYYEWATRAGGEIDNTTTARLISYECKVPHFEKPDEEPTTCLATFWDYAGFLNGPETPKITKIIKGQIPEGTHYKTVDSGFWRWWYGLFNGSSERKIDFIIYIEAERANQQLQKAVKDVISPEI